MFKTQCPDLSWSAGQITTLKRNPAPGAAPTTDIRSQFGYGEGHQQVGPGSSEPTVLYLQEMVRQLVALQSARRKMCGQHRPALLDR